MALRTRGASRSLQFSGSELTAWSAVRGPKKKGKGPSKSEAPESSDIVNIFKDRPDPVIHATHMYPPWLMKMLDETYSPDDVMMQMYRGERIPTGSEQWTLVKSFRRLYLNDQNRYMKEEILYESDDDQGEDTGAMDEEDLT
jgi:Mitochondrial ribosomal protein L37